ncbi:Transcriptional repressor of the fructose operon, DeoR family [Microbacterium esteraromaticum]|uniref:Lactose phosphotransferase system repressor n=1 Tax=Microbacterium esteraromaticum TaxID=57043 RepID=A0A1R4K6K4_9MICO|nr:DeoR/GlpR family DNA-binding transcription regulator [Microbacterium esteraromaticum]SJN39919.1 Transcriptional repressor of the fructose operon, DeoR family [Microbacterium esteraromaticum]
MHDDNSPSTSTDSSYVTIATARTSAAERHIVILELLASHGHVQVTDLANRLSVSEETIRRDLRVLERAERLSRAHGGAVPVRVTSLAAADPEGRALVDQISNQLPDEGAVFLGGDVTGEQATAMLADASKLEVIVSRLDVAISLSSLVDLPVRSLGGEVSSSGEQSGEWSRLELEHIMVDTAVVFVTGFTEQGELMARPSDAAVLRTALRRAHTRVLALDSGSIPASHFTVFAHLTDFDVVVTNAEARTDESSPLAAVPTLIVASAP